MIDLQEVMFRIEGAFEGLDDSEECPFGYYARLEALDDSILIIRHETLDQGVRITIEEI